MKIYIGADHAGFEMKEALKEDLKKAGFEIEDMGAKFLKQDDDSPDYALKVAKKVRRDKKSLGILICRSGIAMSIAANKVRGIRAGLCTNAGQAVSSRAHNDCNILVLSANLDKDANLKITQIFLAGKFSAEERYCQRLEKIKKIENSS